MSYVNVYISYLYMYVYLLSLSSLYTHIPRGSPLYLPPPPPLPNHVSVAYVLAPLNDPLPSPYWPRPTSPTSHRPRLPPAPGPSPPKNNNWFMGPLTPVKIVPALYGSVPMGGPSHPLFARTHPTWPPTAKNDNWFMGPLTPVKIIAALYGGDMLRL
jgi:hypothetical protein